MGSIAILFRNRSTSGDDGRHHRLPQHGGRGLHILVHRRFRYAVWAEVGVYRAGGADCRVANREGKPSAA